MTAPKRHHYLPEAYLSGFTHGGTAESLFYVFDRKDSAFREQTPKNTAVSNHYYTLETQDGDRSPRAEQVLSQVEGIAMPIIRRIEARDPITLEDKLELSLFVALLCTRVPQFDRMTREIGNAIYKHVDQTAVSSVDQASYWIRRHEEKTGEKLDITPEEVYEFFSAGEYDVVFHQNTIIKMMFESALQFAKLLAGMAWSIVFAPPETSFMTSDAPFVRMPPPDHAGPYGFGTPGAITLIPLTQHCCLCIGGRALLVAYNDVPKSEVREVNIAVAQNCERFLIARDEALLRNIVAKSRTERISPPSLEIFGAEVAGGSDQPPRRRKPGPNRDVPPN